MIPFCLAVAIFPEPVIWVFTTDASLIELSIAPLRMLIFSYLFCVPAQIMLHVVSGTGNTRTAMWAEIVTLIVYTLYLVVAVFGFRSNLTICWASEVIYSGGILAYCWTYLKWGRWSERRI
jgi:Na+-driven multidrug efflux pump